MLLIHIKIIHSLFTSITTDYQYSKFKVLLQLFNKILQIFSKVNTIDNQTTGHTCCRLRHTLPIQNALKF
jgi:hypothetical protein